MMKILSSSLMLSLLVSILPVSAKDVPVVPYPKRVQTQSAKPYVLKSGFVIAASEEFLPAAELFMQDVQDLYGIDGEIGSENATIIFKQVPSMRKDYYELTVKSNGVLVKARDYNSVLMGVTTLTQLIESTKATYIPCCGIRDMPSFPYRAYMLDVARQWNELETIKQIVDLCRWYKVPYMQLHLSDDQLFTFESKHYPKLTQGGNFYTQEQLTELVDYATQRGVTIIPEFDLPGHSSAMRARMPELFGEGSWSMIDVASPECVEAVKKIMKEMMDVFHTSPYFHIGADEVSLAKYQTLDHVKEFVEKNKSEVDGVHDLYLRFIVEMHEFVKSNGKQTMVWESFGGKGSKKVEMPTDMFVHAWETLYQSPTSLIGNGFTIINSTWKPCYMTPGRRWSPEYIYNWNARLWENHWSSAPSYSNPVQLSSNKQIMGVQMNAWEMIDYDQLMTAHKRIAAFSETAWNDDKKQSYKKYEPRAEKADAKIMSLIFPAKETRKGFKDADPYALNDNHINYFGHKATVFFEPFNETDTIRYTTNGSLPTIKSRELKEPLELVGKMTAKFMMFDKDGHIRGYKTCPYDLRPLNVQISGDVLPVRDRIFGSTNDKENFCRDIIVTLTSETPDTEIYYTLDGRTPSKNATKYEGPVKVTEKSVFHAAAIDSSGQTVGATYRCNFIKKDKSAPID